jgi:hypothetical protein
MTWVDRVEAARVALWLAIASIAVVVPVGYFRARATEAEAQRQVAELAIRQAEESVKEAAALAETLEKASDNRLTLTSAYMSALNTMTASGSLWFHEREQPTWCRLRERHRGEPGRRSNVLVPHRMPEDRTVRIGGARAAHVCRGRP